MKPVETAIDCDGRRHLLRWEAGHLRTPDHPDPEAERTLGALGGDVPSCIRIRIAWSIHENDPALVTLGRRPGEASLGFAADVVPGTAPMHVAPRRRRVDDATRREELVELLSLPVTFVDRLVLTAMAAAATRWADAGFRERHGLRLGAALSSRAAPALRRLAGELSRPDEAVTVHTAPAGPGVDAPAIQAERSRRGLEVAASLPLSWLATVWGPGLSEPDGLVAVSRSGRGPDAYVVDVVGWVPEGEGRWVGERRRVAVERDPDVGVWRRAPG
jgi:hypothetical protein